MAKPDPIDDSKPTLEERYVGATHASNLRVQAERTGAADTLIAVAWSDKGLGASLMRLHSEWDGLAKPVHQGRDAMKILAATFKKEADGLVQFNGKIRLSPADCAYRIAAQWYLQGLQLVLLQLKTLPEVRGLLVEWCQEQGISDAKRRTAELLIYWLNPNCGVCSGRKWETIAGTPSLSHKHCQHCKGLGMVKIPHEPNSRSSLMESFKILNHIQFCLKTASGTSNARIHGARRRPNPKEEKPSNGKTQQN